MKSPKKIESIGVLTSGGDAPGMNAAVRAVVRSALSQDLKIFGIQRGYSGLLEGDVHPMTVASVANVIQKGGTLLKTSRCKEFHQKTGRKKAFQRLQQFGIDALIVIGGDGSFRGALALHQEFGVPVVGIPGTIDNDIPGTEDTIGFDTAVNTSVSLIDRIRDTASSHDRVFIVEVMGRGSGMIALHTAIGGGAESVCVPEMKSDLKEIVQSIQRGQRRGKTSSIIVVAEGSEVGGAAGLQRILKKQKIESHVAILGHTQRGGSPSAHDRVLASKMGALAVFALIEGETSVMTSVQQGDVVFVPLQFSQQKKNHQKQNEQLGHHLNELLAVLSI